MNDSTRRFARGAGSIVLIILVAALIPKLLSYALGTKYPLASITSSSMWPALKRGDLVLLRHRPPQELKEGMIVAYEDPDGRGVIIHRIVGFDGAFVVTKGDANDTEDEPVPMYDIIGAVPTIGGTPLKLPFLGHVTLLVRSEPSV